MSSRQHKPRPLVSSEAYLGKARTSEQNHDRETALAAYTAVIEQYPARAEGLNLADKVEALKPLP